MESWLLLLLAAALLEVPTCYADAANATDSCPSPCVCKPDGRGQLVTCEGGDLVTIVGGLPHNTARLIIQKLSTTHMLRKSHLGQRNLPITKLSLIQSALQDVESSAFAVLTSLQELDLSQNDIKSVASDAFTGLSRLHFLNLSSNRIAELGQMLEPLVSLRELDVSSNHITDLPPPALHTLTSLTTLRLDGNQLRSLKGASLTSLTLLTHLRARNCNLFYVSDDLFEAIPRITVLDLGNNRLSNFPNSAAFSKLQQLRDLHLDENELLKLHASQFADLNLQTLTLSRNRLIELHDDALKGLMVEDLDLSENKLQHVTGNSLKPVAGLLTRLNLAYNPIRQFDIDTFSSLRQLESLNLSACSLTHLHAEMFKNLFRLHMLDVSWNSLQNISDEMIYVFNRISKVSLQKNDWLCDCHIRPLRDWLQSSRSNQKVFCVPGPYGDYCGSLRCNSPENLAGHRVSLLDDSQLENCGPAARAGLPAATQIGIVMACLVFSLSVLVIVLYLWRRGRIKKGLKRIIFKPRKKDSHDEEDEENEKIDPLENVDIESLKESHRSFVFRHYFDKLVTDPKLLSRPSVSQPPSEVQGEGQTQRDSMYSSNPSLYETSHNSHSIVVGIESTV